MHWERKGEGADVKRSRSYDSRFKGVRDASIKRRTRLCWMAKQISALPKGKRGIKEIRGGDGKLYKPTTAARLRRGIVHESRTISRAGGRSRGAKGEKQSLIWLFKQAKDN